MLRPYIPQQTKFCIIGGKSVRVCAPPFARTGTPAVGGRDTRPVPRFDCGGSFLVAVFDLGAEHLNSSRRSCVTCFSRRFRTRFFIRISKDRLTISAKARRAKPC